nr:hypothetical protein [Candidatus Dadabacteria bacterium]
MIKYIFVLITAILLNVQLAASDEQYTEADAKMLRFPDVSQDKIVFVYAGDIWSVGKNGGAAVRLSSPK